MVTPMQSVIIKIKPQ